VKVDEATRLRPNGWSSLEVRIIDFSETGFRAECGAAVRAGSYISLDVPGVGSVDAQVSWRRDDLLGARFLNPIDLERCGWAAAPERSILARLLVERAEARSSGLKVQEQQLRRQILAALPMVKLGGD
jgi:hypothetical protein